MWGDTSFSIGVSYSCEISSCLPRSSHKPQSSIRSPPQPLSRPFARGVGLSLRGLIRAIPQLPCFLSHPCNPRSFMQLHTLLRNGARLSPLFSTASTLFLSPLGVVPPCVSKYLNVYFNLGDNSSAVALRPFASCPACSTPFVPTIHIRPDSDNRHG